jgi:predicted O-methyltransferase YrrM
MDDFVKELESEINKPISLPSKILMSRFCFLTEGSKFTQMMADPKYFPFYYQLGKRVQPRRLLEVGFGLGFISGCFLQGCKTVEEFTAYHSPKNEFYTFKLGRRNVFSVYKNKFKFINDILELSGEYDLVIINDDNYTIDDYRAILDKTWEHLSYGGLFVIDHARYGNMGKQILPDFFKIVNREPNFVNTRYGVVLLKK